MLDDDYALYSGIRTIFGENVFFRLYNWHVEKNWTKHVNRYIKDQKTRDKILQDLKNISETENYQTLIHLILKFVSDHKKF